MLITFKSKASGDVIMFGDVAKRLMEVMGKSPDNQGIVTVISGQSDDPDSVPSDDPSTPKVDDETITEVFGPTAEEETEEPSGSAIRRIFLPLIER